LQRIDEGWNLRSAFNEATSNVADRS